MKKQKTTVWLFLLVGVLSVITGLRDIFAPGLFSISPHVSDKNEIIVQFAIAAMFFVLAALSSRTQHTDGANKK